MTLNNEKVGIHKKSRIRAVAFDLDGTLVELAIDFNSIRRELGCPQRDILAYIATLKKDAQKSAFEILEKYEMIASAKAELTPGAVEVLNGLQARGIITAIVTRNSAQSALTVINRFNLKVDMIVSRNDAPPKPSPEPLKLIATQYNIPLSSIAMVGDYLYDLECARSAGAIAILLLNPRTEQYIGNCDIAIRSLNELFELLDVC